MIKLFTHVESAPLAYQITPDSRGLMIGSCLATELGERLLGGGANVVTNPQGVLYNPLSIARGVEIFKLGTQFTADDLVQRDGLWHSFAHHSSFSAPTKEEVLAKINGQPAAPLDYIIITLGSAFVYFHQGLVVANCHKFPEAEFVRRRISLAQTIDALNAVRKLYPEAYILLTVSPIRHLRDGLADNSASKATLRLACAEFCEQDPRSGYFPAYEIMMDELRDYRFYADDLLHPSPTAVDIIFERLAASFISPDTLLAINNGLRRKKREGHRPITDKQTSDQI
ncbi:MAG: GSCFA domain-containing protein [Mucinivorans sp.]